ncbi:MAG TPA: DnaA N-terminal domain-containing protein [Candidatus Brocadiia bacterium]|nr:DnaA N-terminal domain-containing protein [Candidatus Brocadiia bacterium]
MWPDWPNAWAAVRERMRRELGDAVFEAWIGPLSLESADHDELKIGAAKPFVRNWVANHYIARIERAFRSRVLPALKDETRIRHSRLGQDASLLGAAALVFDAMFKSPKRLLGLNGQDLEGSTSGKETAHEGDRGSEQG